MKRFEKNEKMFLIPFAIFVLIVSIICMHSINEQNVIEENFYVPNVFVQHHNYFEQEPQTYAETLADEYTSYGSIKSRVKARTLTNKDLTTNHNKYLGREVFVSEDDTYIFIQLKDGRYECLIKE